MSVGEADEDGLGSTRVIKEKVRIRMQSLPTELKIHVTILI